MPKYRTHFELGIEELKLIEHSLSARVGQLSQDALDLKDEKLKFKDCETVAQKVKELKEIRELLGRLHDQKIWYEPDVYVPRG